MSTFKINDLAIIRVDESHRLADYNRRIIKIIGEQPDIPAVIGHYVIESAFNGVYNGDTVWSFVNTADSEDLISYEQGVRESMIEVMKRINRGVESIGVSDNTRSE